MRNLLIMAFLVGHFAYAVDCGNLLAGGAEARKEVQALSLRSLRIKFLPDLVDLYDKSTKQNSDLKNILSPGQVYQLALNDEQPYYAKVLFELLQGLDQDNRSVPLRQKWVAAVKTTLVNKVPASSISRRIADFFEGKPNSLIRILGDMERAEVNELLYGSDVFHPSPESLLGQYLAKTGATTLKRSFPIAPGHQTMGPERMVVSVSHDSYETFAKYFFRLEFTTVFGHAFMMQNGVMNSYAHRDEEFRPQSPGNILPWVVLKTTEGQRLDFYFRGVNESPKGGWNQDLYVPWNRGYCEASAWLTCTQWIGNIPIGDNLVTTWTLPAPGEMIVSERNGTQSNKPLVTALHEGASQEPMFARVFKVPGHMQFSEVIGQKEANAAGEFANPGWVVQTLIGPTDNQYVPIVFLWSQNHTQPIAPDFVPNFERPY